MSPGPWLPPPAPRGSWSPWAPPPARASWPPPMAPLPAEVASTSATMPSEDDLAVLAPLLVPAEPPRPRRTLPRALGCALLSAVVPGTGQLLQRRWLAAFLFGVPTLAAVVFGLWTLTRDRATLLTWTVDEATLRNLAVAACAWAIVCLLAAVDAAPRRLAAVAATFPRGRVRDGHDGGRPPRSSAGGRRGLRRHPPEPRAVDRVLRFGDGQGRATQPSQRPRRRGDDRTDPRSGRAARRSAADHAEHGGVDHRRAHDRRALRRRDLPAGPLEHRAARRRRRSAPLGPAHRHDDRGEHRSGHRRSRQHLGATEPARSADAAGPVASPLPQRLRRSGQRGVPLRLHPSRARSRPVRGDQGRPRRAARHPDPQLRARRHGRLREDHRRPRRRDRRSVRESAPGAEHGRPDEGGAVRRSGPSWR